jgi:hypothetical protein
MNNKLATTQKAFIESFIQECYDNGLNEKQANELLTVCRETEALQCDTDFRRGFEQEAQKHAFMQGLKSIGGAVGGIAKKHPLISSSLGLGAGAGTIAAPGLLPNDASSGATTGAIGGGLLGMLPGLAKGFKWQGGLGRTAGSALLKGLFSKGTIRGAIGGAAAGTAAGTVQAIKNSPKLMNPDLGAPGAFSSWKHDGSSAGGANPFGFPSDLMRDVNNYGATSKTLHHGGAGYRDIEQHKTDLSNIEQQIKSLESRMPDGSNPNTYAERQAVQPQLDALKAQRGGIARALRESQESYDFATPRINSLAHQRMQDAGQGLNHTQEEFNNLKGRMDTAAGGGVGGTLMDWYNNLTGAKDRMRVLQPRYNAYNNQMDDARLLQELSE